MSTLQTLHIGPKGIWKNLLQFIFFWWWFCSQVSAPWDSWHCPHPCPWHQLTTECLASPGPQQKADSAHRAPIVHLSLNHKIASERIMALCALHCHCASQKDRLTDIVTYLAPDKLNARYHIHLYQDPWSLIIKWYKSLGKVHDIIFFKILKATTSDKNNEGSNFPRQLAGLSLHDWGIFSQKVGQASSQSCSPCPETSLRKIFCESLFPGMC